MQHERLSALIDGELDDVERATALDEVLGDPALRGAWRRYHLVGDLLRAQQAGEARPAQPAPLAAPSAMRFPLTGLALAAAVAALAFTLLLAPTPEPATTSAAALAAAEPAAATVVAVAQPVARPVAATTAAVATGAAPPPLPTVPPAALAAAAGSGALLEERLNGYLVNFNEERARLGMPGVHPYVRIVGFEAR